MDGAPTNTTTFSYGAVHRHEHQGMARGRVIVQSFDPTHSVFDYARRNDVVGFLEDELGFRQAARFPPFVRMAVVGVEGRDEQRVDDDARWLAEAVRGAADKRDGTGGIEVLGPAPAAVERVQNQHRRRVLLKSDGVRAIQRRLDTVLGSPPRSKAPRGSQVIVDIDPTHLL